MSPALTKFRALALKLSAQELKGIRLGLSRENQAGVTRAIIKRSYCGLGQLAQLVRAHGIKVFYYSDRGIKGK